MYKFGLMMAILGLTSSAFAKKDEVDPRSIDNVAIFAFGGTIEIEEPEGKGGGGLMASINAVREDVETIKGLADGSIKAEAEDDASRGFRMVDAGLEKAFGWKVMDLEEMLANEDYAKLWDEKTPGINKKMSGWGAGMSPKGILNKDLSGTVKEEDRDALCEKLGVEYVATVGMFITGKVQKVKLGRKKVEGVYPTAYTRIVVFKKGEKKPYWKGGATGSKSEDFIHAEEKEQGTIMLQAVQNSLEKLAIKYAPEAG